MLPWGVRGEYNEGRILGPWQHSPEYASCRWRRMRRWLQCCRWRRCQLRRMLLLTPMPRSGTCCQRPVALGSRRRWGLSQQVRWHRWRRPQAWWHLPCQPRLVLLPPCDQPGRRSLLARPRSRGLPSRRWRSRPRALQRWPVLAGHRRRRQQQVRRSAAPLQLRRWPRVSAPAAPQIWMARWRSHSLAGVPGVRSTLRALRVARAPIDRRW